MKFYLKYMATLVLKVILFPFRCLPLHKNQILFIGLEGGGDNEYSCNPMYMCEYLLEHAKNQWEYVWLVKDVSAYSFLEKKGIRLAKHFSIRSFYYATTSNVVITNGGYISWFPFRKKQCIINTWHGGGAYKKLENDLSQANWATNRRMKFSAKNMDYFLSSCRLFTKYVIRGAFQYPGEVLEIGMPRNDILLQADGKKAAGRVRRFYSIPNHKKVLLYAPTFRDYELPAGQDMEIADLLKVLEQRFGGEWIFMYRTHVQTDRKSIYFKPDQSMIDAGTYPDAQELLCLADVLITDYSSIVWDYSLTGKPCFLYAPDVEEYLQTRGFYVDIHEWPFSLCENFKQLYMAIEQFSEESYQQGLYSHHQMLGSCETGQACEKLTKIIEQYVNLME